VQRDLEPMDGWIDKGAERVMMTSMSNGHVRPLPSFSAFHLPLQDHPRPLLIYYPL